MVAIHSTIVQILLLYCVYIEYTSQFIMELKRIHCLPRTKICTYQNLWSKHISFTPPNMVNLRKNMLIILKYTMLKKTVINWVGSLYRSTCVHTFSSKSHWLIAVVSAIKSTRNPATIVNKVNKELWRISVLDYKWFSINSSDDYVILLCLI